MLAKGHTDWGNLIIIIWKIQKNIDLEISIASTNSHANSWKQHIRQRLTSNSKFGNGQKHKHNVGRITTHDLFGQLWSKPYFYMVGLLNFSMLGKKFVK